MQEALPDLSGVHSILTSGGFCGLGPVPKPVILWMAGAFRVAGEVATANEIISFLEFADREGVDPNHVDRFLVNSKKVRLHTISKSDRGRIQKAKSQSRFWDILWADDGAHRFYHSKEVLRQIAGDETDYLDYVRRVVMALAIPPPLGTTYDDDDVVRAILRGNSGVEDLIFRALKYLNETGHGLPRSFEGLSETHPALAEKIARYCRDRGMGFLTRPFVVVDEIGAREVSLPHALSTSTFKRLDSLGPRRATIHDIIVALDMAGNLLNDCALFLLRHVPGVAGMWGDLAIHYPWAKVFKTLPYVGGHYSDEWILHLHKHDSPQQRSLVERVVGVGALTHPKILLAAKELGGIAPEYSEWLRRLSAKAIHRQPPSRDILTTSGVVRQPSLVGEVNHYYQGLFANNRDQGGKSRAMPFLQAVGKVDGRADIFLSQMRAGGFEFTDLEEVKEKYPELKVFNSFVRALRWSPTEHDHLYLLAANLDRPSTWFMTCEDMDLVRVLWSSDDLVRDLRALVGSVNPDRLLQVLHLFGDNDYLNFSQLRQAVDRGVFDSEPELKEKVNHYLGSDDLGGHPEDSPKDKLEFALTHPQWYLTSGGLKKPLAMSGKDLDAALSPPSHSSLEGVSKVMEAVVHGCLRTRPTHERGRTLAEVQKDGVFKGYRFDAPHCSYNAYKLARESISRVVCFDLTREMLRDLMHATARWLSHSLNPDTILAMAMSEGPGIPENFLGLLEETIKSFHTWGEIDHNRLAEVVADFQTRDKYAEYRSTPVGKMFNRLEGYLRSQATLSAEDSIFVWFRGQSTPDILSQLNRYGNGRIPQETIQRVRDRFNAPQKVKTAMEEIMEEEDRRILEVLNQIAKRATENEPPEDIEDRPNLLAVIKDDITTSALRVGVKHTRSAVTELVTSFINRVTVERLEGESEVDYNLRAEGMRSGVTGFLLGETGQSVISYMVGLSWAVAGNPESGIAKYADPIAQEMRAQGGSELLDGFLESVVFPFVSHMTEQAARQPRVRVAPVLEASIETVKEAEALPVHIREMDCKAFN